MAKPTLAQTEPEFRASISRILDGKDAGLSNPRPDYDTVQAREFHDEMKQGRKEAAYVQALEAHGFRFFPDSALLARGVAPTGQGLWRHPRVLYQMAFTPDEVVANFDSPEAFDKWVKEHKSTKELLARHRAGQVSRGEVAAAKIVIARG